MSLNKSYAVFGLGRYGSAVAKELYNSGAEVLAVDMDEHIVDELAPEIPLCKCADVTDVNVVRQLGIANIDVVIIAMAQQLEASVMAVMHCKDLGVPKVIVKCSSEIHQQILKKVGADMVVFPESESGTRLARNLLSSGLLDIFELSKDVSMVELDMRKEWIGKSIMELNLRKKYGINIVAICRNNDISINIDPNGILEEGMKLVVIANTSQLNKLT